VTGSAWIAFVSRRWFAARRESGGSASSVLAASGIAIGVAALIVVLGVMNGFQMGFIDSILEIASFHLRIDDDRRGGPDSALLARLAADPAVRSVLPFAETRCLITTVDGRTQALSLRAVPSDAADRDRSLLPSLGIEGRLFPEKKISTESTSENGVPDIVIGAELARFLDISTGDKAELLVVQAGGDEGAEVQSIKIRISRLFRSGFFDYDFGLAFISLDSSAAIFPAERPLTYTYGVKLKDRYGDLSFADRLSFDYGLGPERVQGWRDYNRAFFGALRTEKTVMMEDIALLRAIGASSEALRRSFVLDGLAIGAGGAFMGLIAGLLIAVNVNGVFALAELVMNEAAILSARLFGGGEGTDFRVFSPQYFYLMEVPVRVLFPETLFVVAAAVTSAAFAAWSASVRISRFTPAEILRHE
jgi:lipoprotein-releasing system permease protein